MAPTMHIRRIIPAVEFIQPDKYSPRREGSTTTWILFCTLCAHVIKFCTLNYYIWWEILWGTVGCKGNMVHDNVDGDHLGSSAVCTNRYPQGHIHFDEPCRLCYWISLTEFTNTTHKTAKSIKKRRGGGGDFIQSQ